MQENKIDRLAEIDKRLGVLQELTNLITQNSDPDVFYAGNYKVNRLFESDIVQVLLCKAKNGSMANHVHNESIEYMIVISGQEDIFINGNKKTLKKDDVVKIMPGSEHYSDNIKDIVKICVLIPPESKFSKNENN